MGDSGIGFEALSTGDCRLFRSSARNWPRRLLGLLQQYRREAVIGQNRRSCNKRQGKLERGESVGQPPQGRFESNPPIIPRMRGIKSTYAAKVAYDFKRQDLTANPVCPSPVTCSGNFAVALDRGLVALQGNGLVARNDQAFENSRQKLKVFPA
jgi:hypothetical protein